MNTNRRRAIRAEILEAIGRDNWDREALAFADDMFFRMRVVRAVKPILLGKHEKSRLRRQVRELEGDLRKLRSTFDEIDPQLWALLVLDPDSLEPGQPLEAGRQTSIVSRIAEELRAVDECLSAINGAWPKSGARSVDTFSLAPLLEDVLYSLERHLGAPADRAASAEVVLALIEKHVGFGWSPDGFDKIFRAVDRRLRRRGSSLPASNLVSME